VVITALLLAQTTVRRKVRDTRAALVVIDARRWIKTTTGRHRRRTRRRPSSPRSRCWSAGRRAIECLIAAIAVIGLIANHFLQRDWVMVNSNDLRSGEFERVHWL
jgi:hypothetical protein